MSKHTKKFDLVAETKSFFNITPFSPILPWIDRNVTMVDDVSSERDRPDFSMYPYQVDILKQWEDLDIRKHVTVVMCEQMRKDFYIRLWHTLQADIQARQHLGLLPSIRQGYRDQQH